MTATTKDHRELPADVYDALELSALAFGGIGAGSLTADHAYPYGVRGWHAVDPLCAMGHAGALDGKYLGGAWKAVTKTGIDGPVNDFAVRVINRRKRRPRNARVTFREWCRELNVVRGE